MNATLEKDAEELRKYALEIMALKPPKALAALFMAASAVLADEFPHQDHTALISKALECVITEVAARRVTSRDNQ